MKRTTQNKTGEERRHNTLTPNGILPMTALSMACCSCRAACAETQVILNYTQINTQSMSGSAATKSTQKPSSFLTIKAAI